MTDDSDESYDRPMSPGLRSRSPPHRARLKMPNEEKVLFPKLEVDGLCITQAADTQKDFGRLTRNVKLTTHEAAARGAPKTAKQKIFFVAQGARREERKNDTAGSSDQKIREEAQVQDRTAQGGEAARL